LQNVEPAFATIARDGVPNAFGQQRFGRDKDNADRALAFLRGEERPPKDKFQRRFLFSALQSHVFNRVLERRVQDGTWNRALEGDLLKKRDTGGLFVCADVQADGPRAERGDVSATGPMFGLEMREPGGVVRALEEEVLRDVIGELDLERTRGLGDGTRRVLRLWVEGIVVRPREQDESCEVEFVLPKGAFATTVLGGVFELREERAQAGADHAASSEGATVPSSESSSDGSSDGSDDGAQE
jgi:tRNA pseudouridine13 synthase